MDEERKTALLQKISEKQDNGRADRKATPTLQDKLRLIDRELEEDSGASNGTSSESGEGTDGPLGDEGLGGNGDSRFPFSDGQTDESDSGSYQDSTGIEGDVETTRPVKGTEKKPGGLNIVPSKREKKVRSEEARKRANAEKQRAFRARKKAAAVSDVETSDAPPARRSVLDLLPKIEKAEKAVRKAFTEAEAKAIKPMLVSAMMDYFSYADELLYATVKGHPRVEIWSSIDDEECGILADVLIARGKKSAAGAAQIQAMVDVHKNLKVGMILAPRFYQTFRLYMDNGGMSLKN
jgi:hypothetical protein